MGCTEKRIKPKYSNSEQSDSGTGGGRKKRAEFKKRIFRNTEALEIHADQPKPLSFNKKTSASELNLYTA